MWDDWVGKKVFIKLVSGECYNATVIEVDSSFMRILDRYNETLNISIAQILKIVDETGGTSFKNG